MEYGYREFQLAVINCIFLDSFFPPPSSYVPSELETQEEGCCNSLSCYSSVIQISVEDGLLGGGGGIHLFSRSILDVVGNHRICKSSCATIVI